MSAIRFMSAAQKGDASPFEKLTKELDLIALISGDFALDETTLKDKGSLEDNLKFLKLALSDIEIEGFDKQAYLEKILDRKPSAHDINSIPATRSVLYPLAWSGSHVNYSLLEIEKNPNGTFKIYFYNSGNGLSSHDAVIDSFSEKISTALVIDNIDPSKLTSLFFTYLEDLTSNQTPASFETIYKSLYEYFKGQSIDCLQAFKDKELLGFTKKQRAQTDAWKCIMMSLKHHTRSYQVYRKLKHAIWNFAFSQIKGSLEKHFTRCSLAEKRKIKDRIEPLLQKFGRSVAKSAHFNIIASRDVGNFHLLITAIVDSLVFSLDDEKVAPIVLQGEAEIEKVESSTTSTKELLESEFEPAIPRFLGPVPVLDFSNITNLRDQLSKLVDYLRSSSADLNKSFLQTCIVGCIKNLPVPVRGEAGEWDQIPEHEKAEISALITVILDKYLKQEMVDQQRVGFSLNITAWHHLLAIVDHLRMTSTESLWPKIELDAFNIEELPTRNALMLSPEDNEYCKTVARYFKSRTKRVDKLFYFQWIEGFNGVSNSYGLSKELSRTPTERFLKQYLTEKQTHLGAFFNSLPQIDQSLFSLFSLIQQNTFSFFNRGDKSPDDFSLIKLDFSRLQNNSDGDYFFQGSPKDSDFQVFPREMSAEEAPAHTFALGFHNFLKSSCTANESLSGLNLVDKEEKRLEKFFFEHFPSPFDTFFLTQDKKTIVYRVLKYLKMNRSFKQFPSDHLLVQTLFSQHFLEVSTDTNLLKTLAKYFIEDYQYSFSVKDFEKATIALFYLMRISKLAPQGFEIGMNPSDELKRLSKELKSSYVIEVVHCAICLLQNEPLDYNLLGLMCRSVFLIKNSDYFLKDQDEFKLSFHLTQLIARMIELKFFDEKEKIANLLIELSEQEVTEFINTRVLGSIVKLPSWKKIDDNPFAFKSENNLNYFSIFDSLFFPKDSKSLQPLAFFANLCKKGKIHHSDFSLFGTGFIDEKRLFRHYISELHIYLEIDGRRLTLEPTLREEVKKEVDLIEKKENLPFRFAFVRRGFWALFFGDKERRFDLTFDAQESKIKDSESSLLVQYSIAKESEKRLKDSILPSYSHRIEFSCELVNDQQGAAAAAAVNITAKVEGNLVLNLDRGSQKLCLDADPLFVLATPPRFLFGQFNNFIILLNERTGAQKVVFLGKKLTYIDRDNDGSFYPKSTLEKIALAKAFFLGKEYRSAFDWIIRSVPIGKMSKEEFDHFYRIIDTKDQHPDALVCKLKIFSILNQEMVLNTPLKESLDGYFKENFNIALSDTYEDFLTKEANTTLKLKEEDERTLHIDRGFLSKILASRKRLLTQGLPFPISKTKVASSEPFFQLELHRWYHQLNPVSYDLTLAERITPEKFIQMILDVKKGQNREFLYLLALFKKRSDDPNEKVFAHMLQGFLDGPDLHPFEPPYDFKLFETVIKRLKGRSYIVDSDQGPYVGAKAALVSSARKERMIAPSIKKLELRVDISPPTEFNEKILTSFMGERKDIYEQLMKLAQVLPSDEEEKALAEIKRDFETPLSFAELTELFIRNNINAYLERTYLSQEGAQELHQRLGHYFAITLKINQIQNILQIQKESETCSADERELLEKRLDDAQVQRSYYNPSEFPEFLVFEAQGKMRMYERQIRNLEILTAGGNPVVQMNMGDGKSQVISPIVALQLAKQGALPIIVVPTSLYATGKEKASDTLYNAFGNLGQGFEFSRETEITEAKIELILHSLQSQKKRQGYIYTTKENLLSFILKIQEVFYNESYKEAPNLKLLEDASKILSFIKTYSVALFDEIHELLDPNKEVNFTFGAKSTIDLDEADFVRKVILKLLSIDELGLAENLQSQATEDVHQKIQENLLELFKEEFKKDYRPYFTDKEMMDEATHPKKNLLALAKQLFTQLLPYALSKKCGEHFGLRENQVLAIPYCANNTPTVNSEFSLRYETLLFTYFYYAQKGVDTLLIKKYVDEELASAISESRSEGKPIHETEISQSFAAKHHGLSILDDEVISKLHGLINSDRSRVLDFVYNEIAPLISTHEKKLGANGQDLFHMFKAVLGMTGTPWNDQSYPSPLKVYKDEDIDRLSQTLVLERKDDQVYFIEATKAEEIKNLLLDRIIEGNYETFIDAGALIKGFTNKQFAENLLMDRRFKFNGVAFYDERSDELFVLQRLQDGLVDQVPFEKCKLLKEERFTFYDQRHTTGSDIKQAVKAKALVSFSETTKKYEFYQSFWRMRGVGKGQSFDMVTTQKVGGLFGLQKSKKAEIALNFMRENESRKIKIDNFKAVKAEIKSIAQAAMRARLFDPSNPNKTESFRIFEEYLFDREDFSAYELFGAVSQERKTAKLLTDFKNKWKGVLLSLSQKGYLGDVHQYLSAIDSVKEREYFDTYKEANELGLEVKKEVMAEALRETETEQEVELEAFGAHGRPQYEEFVRFDWDEFDTLDHLKLETESVDDASLAAPEPAMTPDEKKEPQVDAKSTPRWRALISKIVSKVKTFLVWIAQLFKKRSHEIVEHKIENPPVVNPAPATAPIRRRFSYQINSGCEEEFKGVFDPNLYYSINFSRPFNMQTLINGYMKSLDNVLVIKQKDRPIEMMAIDSDELAAIREKLPEPNDERQLFVYTPFVGEHKDHLAISTLVQTDEFVKKMVQMKFLGGYSAYKKNEMVHLKSWIREQGHQKMRKLFSKIVSVNATRKSAYSKSDLSRALSAASKAS